MEGGNCIYFGPWNASAQEQLSRVLPASHLLAAAGSAEAPRDPSKVKPKATRTNSKLQLAATNLADNMGKKKQAANSLTMSQVRAGWLGWCCGGLALPSDAHMVVLLNYTAFHRCATSLSDKVASPYVTS